MHMKGRWAIVGGGLIHGKGLISGHDKYTGYYTDKPDQPGEGDKAIALRECRNVTSSRCVVSSKEALRLSQGRMSPFRKT